ncbi:MAG: methionyl-tRNA formyltransferase [Myxococcota bacterium]|nr:methionyl-tRNA formyltransferase [Myxococcota bacterium]
MTLRLAVFGQAPFGRDVAVRLSEAGHEIAYTHVPPDRGSRADPLAAEAEARGWPLVRHKAFRRKGEPIAERVEEFLAAEVDLCVMPFTTVILPPAIVETPRLGALCFHPSLLPAYRGGNALAWQIILGAKESGVTVFRPDEGVDTGPIVVQRGGVEILPTDNTVSLYFDRLYPLGVDALAEAVAQVAAGESAPRVQSEDGASFQGLVDDEVARIDWSKPAEEVDRLIRGCDPQPGAWAQWQGQRIRLFGGRRGHEAHDAHPGTVLGPDPEDVSRVRVAVGADSFLSIQKVRLADGSKVSAAEAGLEAGSRLE